MLLVLKTLTLTAALAAPPVEVATLDGREVSGEFVSLSSRQLVVKTEEGEQSLAVEGLLEVVFPESKGPTTAGPDVTRVALVDGTELDASSVLVAKGSATVTSLRTGTFDVPLPSLRYVRFPGTEERFGEVWRELATKPTKSDLLVVRKPTVLDHLKGILGDVTAEKVAFAIGGNEIPVSISKLYGIVYGNRASSLRGVACVAELHGADKASLASLQWTGDGFEGKLASGGPVAFGADVVRSIDFSIGKVRFLSRMEPESVDYTTWLETENGGPDPFWLQMIRYRRDENLYGQPLRIGGTRFSRGLCIHSKTTLKYRLASDYRTFKAVLGFEKAASSGAQRVNVRFVVKGDEKVLLDEKVANGDKPRELELDVENVNFLEITVDFGEDGLDTLDHLALGDARVLK